MSRLLRRIKRARRTSADDGPPESAGTVAPVADAHEPSAENGSGTPLPAGRDPADPRPTALSRGRLRKRLRFLERERELLLRDLGGLVYEIHRTGAASDREHHRELVTGKVRRLAALDGEHGAGLATLSRTRGETVLREPGIGGVCPRCGEIFGSDARFCSACGSPVPGGRTPAPEAAALATAPQTSDLVLPEPASAGAGSSPAHGDHEIAGADRPARRDHDPADRQPEEDEPTRLHRPAARAADDARTEVDITPAPPGRPSP